MCLHSLFVKKNPTDSKNTNTECMTVLKLLPCSSAFGRLTYLPHYRHVSLKLSLGRKNLTCDVTEEKRRCELLSLLSC